MTIFNGPPASPPVAFPAAPVLAYSFTAFSANTPQAQQPGAQLDANFNQICTAISAILTALKVSLNADGTLNPNAVANAITQGNLNNTNLNNAGSANGDASLAQSAASAALAQAWAEFLPGPLPASTLAQTEVTGDHWSSRWWANYCAGLVALIQAEVADFEASVAGQVASGKLSYVAAASVVPIQDINLEIPTLQPGAIDGTNNAFPLYRGDTGTAASPMNASALIVVRDGVILQPNVNFFVSAANVLSFDTPPTPDGSIFINWIAPGAPGSVPTPTIDGGTF